MVRTTLSRISNILRSNVNELLDQLEDPEKMVRQMVRDLEADVDRVTAAVGTAVAAVRRLQKEQETQRLRSQQLQTRAGQALDAGDEPLARQILARRVLLAQAADDLQPALDEGGQTVERLKSQLTSLRADLQDARNRQGSLIARIRAHKGTVAAPGQDEQPHDPFDYLQRLEQRLEHNRGEFDRLRQRLELSDVAEAAAAEARSELGGDDYADAVLGGRFADLEVQQRVDAELAALRSGETDR